MTAASKSRRTSFCPISVEAMNLKETVLIPFGGLADFACSKNDQFMVSDELLYYTETERISYFIYWSFSVFVMPRVFLYYFKIKTYHYTTVKLHYRSPNLTESCTQLVFLRSEFDFWFSKYPMQSSVLFIKCVIEINEEHHMCITLLCLHAIQLVIG